MSRKTENIYKAISRLEDLKDEISVVAKLARADMAEDSLQPEAPCAERLERLRHLENIEFEMGQCLKSLRFLIGSLYACNGKSTSRAKKSASRQNGMKGGRPPKRVTQARRGIKEIEDEILPELERGKILSGDFMEERRIEAEIESAKERLSALRKTVGEWEESRKSSSRE